MSGKREIEPSAEILDTAIRKIVVPTLERIAADAGRRISLDAAVWHADTAIANLPQIEAGITGNPILPGKLRLRFRDAFGGRTLMHAEAIFDRELAVAKCSGFYLKADLRDGVAKRTAFTVRYSVWDWTGWV
jgi:hypothetical protein